MDPVLSQNVEDPTITNPARTRPPGVWSRTAPSTCVVRALTVLKDRSSAVMLSQFETGPQLRVPLNTLQINLVEPGHINLLRNLTFNPDQY